MKTLLLLLTLSFASFAETTVQTLLVSTNNYDNLVAHLKVHVDEKGDIVKFEEIAFKGAQTVKQNLYSPQALQKGIVLHRDRNRDIILLKSPTLSEGNGGVFEMKYLANGISGSWGSEEIDLRRDADKWSLYYKGTAISKAFLMSNRKPIIGVIGIKKIQFE